MAFSLGQLDALENAIASGAMSVSYEGKSTSFRSVDDMLRIRDIIRRALGLAPGASATVLIGHNKGFGYGSADSGIGWYGADGFGEGF